MMMVVVVMMMMMMIVDNLTEEVVSSELSEMSMNVTQLDATRDAISTLQQIVEALHRDYVDVRIWRVFAVY